MLRIAPHAVGDRLAHGVLRESLVDSQPARAARHVAVQMALGGGGDLVAEEVEGDDARGWIRHHPEQRRVAAVEADLADVAHMRLGGKPPVHPPLLWYLARVTFELARVMAQRAREIGQGKLEAVRP